MNESLIGPADRLKEQRQEHRLPEQVPAEAAHLSDSLVNMEWLDRHGSDPDVCLVEIDWDGTHSYEEGHIPGALGWQWKSMLWDPYERQFPSRSDFAKRLGEAGIDRDTTVVFYGAPVQFGTYAWWVFKYCGHRDVRMLDGGKVRWQAEGRNLTLEVPHRQSATYVPYERSETIRAGRRDVMQAVQADDVCILDHRSLEEYSGERVGLPGKADVGAERYGRIPGALHLPFDHLLNDDDTFKSKDALAHILSTIAPDKGQPIVSYCRLSHRATLASFALTEILGYDNVRVYDGSWTEWGSMVGAPIER